MKVWGRLDLVQGLYCQEFGACLSDPWAQPELRGGGFCHCCCWGGTVHTSWGWGLESPRDPHEQAPTPRSCAGSGRPPRVNRTTAIPPSKSPKDPDRSGSWGCDPKGRNWPGSSSPLLPPPPHRAPVPMASGSWGLSSPCPCPRVSRRGPAWDPGPWLGPGEPCRQPRCGHPLWAPVRVQLPPALNLGPTNGDGK